VAGLSSRRRILVSSVLAVALVGGGVALRAGATSPPNLPAIAPGRLVASTLAAMQRHPAHSGDVLARLDLGLPSVPGVDPGTSNGPLSFISSVAGEHRLRVWSSADGLRVADLTRFGERSLFLTPADAWAWDSDSYTAFHLEAGAPDPGKASPLPVGPPDPQSMAREALALIGPSTAITMAPPARVAGRDAYVLRLTPRTPGTLVGRIEVSIDAQRRIPLGLGVFARDHSSPSVSVAYRTIGFDPIDPSTFRFTPPPGATVKEPRPGAGGKMGSDGGPESPFEYAGSGVRTFGMDWATVVAIRTPAPSRLMSGKQGEELRLFLPFSGPLLSATLVDRGDHGWLVYGAVPPSALTAVQSLLP
jgi:hypothetical protein